MFSAYYLHLHAMMNLCRIILLESRKPQILCKVPIGSVGLQKYKNGAFNYGKC